VPKGIREGRPDGEHQITAWRRGVSGLAAEELDQGGVEPQAALVVDVREVLELTARRLRWRHYLGLKPACSEGYHGAHSASPIKNKCAAGCVVALCFTRSNINC
jgi:hypothetical protein